MKIICFVLLILLNQLTGHCCLMSDDSITNDVSTSLQIENVQLTKYKNGEIIELQQQNFIDLQINLLNNKKLFEDKQFSRHRLFPGHLMRPKEIVDDPVFCLNNKKYSQIQQGNIGNCWFIIGLINLQYHKSLFKFIVSPETQTFTDDNYAGIFHFKFWQAGSWVDVVVDDRLPTFNKKLFYASSENEFWPALIEKSYAKLLYRSYKKLHGGYSKIAMQDLSGGIPEFYWIDKSYQNLLFKIIYNALSKRKKYTMIGCGTIDDKQMLKKLKINIKLQSDHYYAITNVKIIKGKKNNEFKLLRIRNPYGISDMNFYPSKIMEEFSDDLTKIDELKIDIDGESWILFEDFIEYFDHIDICNLTPNKIIGDIYTENGKKKLILSAIEGKLMGGLNSKKTTADDYITMFPQYRIILKEPDKENLIDKKCNILIGLSVKRRHDLVPISDTSIFFDILKCDENNMIKEFKPLNFRDTKCIKIDSFEAWGQVSGRFILSPGIYYIIPYITDTYKGASFYLQVLSEHKNILEVYDRDIYMPHISNKIYMSTSSYIDDIDRYLFLTRAIFDGKYQTIDFKDLYFILKNDKFSLNRNYHIALQLDDIFISELETLSEMKKLVPKKKLSIARITEITLKIEEAFEIYERPGSSGYIYAFYMINMLEHDGFSINIDIIYALFNKIKDKIIHINDLFMIVFYFKSQFGSYIEEFNAKLCQDLISMVHYDSPSKLSNNFDKSEIHNTKINMEQFKNIIQFIKKLKEIFYNHASGSYVSVPFTKLKNILDEFQYNLTYNIIATIFQKYGNDDDIYYHQFVQSVVDITIIFEKIQISSSTNGGKNLNKSYQELFFKFWNRKTKKINTNKRKFDSSWDEDEPETKKNKI